MRLEEANILPGNTLTAVIAAIATLIETGLDTARRKMESPGPRSDPPSSSITDKAIFQTS